MKRTETIRMAGAVLLVVAVAGHGQQRTPGPDKPSPFGVPAAEAPVQPAAPGDSAAKPVKMPRPPASQPSAAGDGMLDFLDLFQVFSGKGKADRETIAGPPAAPDTAPTVVPASASAPGASAPAAPGPSPAWAAPAVPGQVLSLAGNMHGAMNLMVGKSLLIDSAARVQRISIADGEIAEAVAVSPRELLVHGKAAGETSLVIWQEGGRRQLFDLKVAPSTVETSRIQEELDALPGVRHLRFQVANERVILSGEVPDVTTARRAEAIAGTLGKVVSLLNVDVPDVEPQVLLKVRFANIDRSNAHDQGFNLLSLGATNTIGSTTTGQYGPPRWQTQGDTPIASFSDALNIFMLRPDLNLGATIKLLQSRRILEILAEPNLLTINGKKASFLAGGEFPFPVIQGGANVGAVTITFREFGIRINFTPNLTARGTIRLKVNPEVSSLDFSNALLIQGFTVPAINTRRVDTEVELESGQSFAIAGLLDQRSQQILSKIPGVGDIPILGKLFQSKNQQRNDTELLVVVTPELVRPIPQGQPTPQVEMPEPFLRQGVAIPRQPGLAETGPVPVEPKQKTVPLEQILQEIKTSGAGGTGAADSAPFPVPMQPQANPGLAPGAAGVTQPAGASTPVASQPALQ